MSIRWFFVVLLSLILLPMLLYRILDAVSCRRPVPAWAQEVYHSDTLETWKAYRSKITRFDLGCALVNYTLMILAMGTNLLTGVLKMTPLSAGSVAAVTLISLFLIHATGIALDYYRQMVLKPRYGMDDMDGRAFRRYALLRLLFLLAADGAVTLMVYFIYVTPAMRSELRPETITPVPWIVFMGGMILLKHAVIPAIRGIREHPKPLADGSLKVRLTELAGKAGYRGRICVGEYAFGDIAHYSLIGNRIVIDEEAVRELDEEEVTAAVLRAMAHAVHRDEIKRILLSVVDAAIIIMMFWLFDLAILTAQPVTFDDPVTGRYAIGCVICAVLLPVHSYGFGNMLYRKQEQDADELTVKFGYEEEDILLWMWQLEAGFGDLNPHPLKEFLFMKSPSPANRIQRIGKEEGVQL